MILDGVENAPTMTHIEARGRAVAVGMQGAKMRALPPRPFLESGKELRANTAIPLPFTDHQFAQVPNTRDTRPNRPADQNAIARSGLATPES